MSGPTRLLLVTLLVLGAGACAPEHQFTVCNASLSSIQFEVGYQGTDESAATEIASGELQTDECSPPHSARFRVLEGTSYLAVSTARGAERTTGGLFTAASRSKHIVFIVTDRTVLWRRIP